MRKARFFIIYIGGNNQFLKVNFTEKLAPHRPVECAVVDRFQHMVSCDAFAAFEITSVRATFKMRSCARALKLMAGHCVLKEAEAFRIQFAMLANQPRPHASVGVDALLFRKTLALDGACFLHALTNRLRTFG